MTARGVVIGATPSELRRARYAFKRDNHVRIARFIEPALLGTMHKHLRRAHFEESEYAAVGRDLAVWDSPVDGALHLLMNDPSLLRFVSSLTGCPVIGSFIGRLYRMIARPGMDFDWHSDLVANDVRVGVAMTINLGTRPYRGGMLQMRRTDQAAITEIPNDGSGDAIIFRLARGFQHRVTPVEGKQPKTAFTGWFLSTPSFNELREEWLAGSRATAAPAGRSHPPRMPPKAATASIPSAVVALGTPRETILASMRTGRFYGLNPTAARMWEVMAESRSLHQAALTLAREYGVPSASVERDLIALATSLASRQLLTLATKSKPSARQSNRGHETLWPSR